MWLVARARTMATRCCCPPERRSGTLGLRGQSDAQQFHPALVGALGRQVFTCSARVTLSSCDAGGEVVVLEDDTDAGPDLVGVDAGVGDVLAGEEDLPVVDALEQVRRQQSVDLPDPEACRTTTFAGATSRSSRAGPRCRRRSA